MYYEKEGTRDKYKSAKLKARITGQVEQILYRMVAPVTGEQKMFIGILVQSVKDALHCSGYNMSVDDSRCAVDFIESKRCDIYCEMLNLEPDDYRRVAAQALLHGGRYDEWKTDIAAEQGIAQISP